MASLKLGKLPDRNTVKMTFTASAQLSSLLEEYATLYEKTYGTPEKIENLIPFMLEAFINSDVWFRRARKKDTVRRVKIGSTTLDSE